MQSFTQGDMVPIRIPCKINGNFIVPTDVYLSIKVSGEPAMRWHWPDDPGPIVETALGTFLALVDSTTYPRQWEITASWKGAGTQAVGTAVCNVNPPSVPPLFGS